MMRLLVALVLMAVIGPSMACRCKPQPLADYFEAADQVWLGRVTAADNRADHRKLTIEPLRGNFKATTLHKLSPLALFTASSTATCGIAPEIGATYVLFPHMRDGKLWVDSCDGSRLLLPTQDSSDAAAGRFIDVPSRHVVQQLNGLGGAWALRRLQTASAPNHGNAKPLLGLLDLKTLVHGGSVDLVAAPHSGARRVARFEDWNALEHQEIGYEVPAAVVLGRRDGWSLLQLNDGRQGWISPEQSGTWFPYPELVMKRLNYLNSAWSGWVWPSAGAGLPMRHQPGARALDRGEYPVRIHELTRIGGEPWLRIDVLQHGECEGPRPAVKLSGWVPAYGATSTGPGHTAWFYSRGC